MLTNSAKIIKISSGELKNQNCLIIWGRMTPMTVWPVTSEKIKAYIFLV